MKTVEELLKPRILVTNDYPNSPYKKDEILEFFQQGQPLSEKGWLNLFIPYPHLFKPLEWWMNREESDMPEYVKLRTEKKLFAEVNMHYKEHNRWNSRPDYNKFCCITNLGTLDYDNLLPATADDYNTYLETVK